jgi:intron-binding protein aquarius
MNSLDQAQLLQLAHKLRLLDIQNTQNNNEAHLATLLQDREFVLQVLIQGYLKQPREVLPQNTPLFPTETLLGDATRLPPRHSFLLLPSRVLNLPKLYATQFVSFAEYLYRNFTLLQLETASDIAADLVTSIGRLRPFLTNASGTPNANDNDNNDAVMADAALTDTKMITTFAGWARMALEIKGVTVVKVEPPLLGHTRPQNVLVGSRAVWISASKEMELARRI